MVCAAATHDAATQDNDSSNNKKSFFMNDGFLQRDEPSSANVTQCRLLDDAPIARQFRTSD
jgi:hypothetical protein